VRRTLGRLADAAGVRDGLAGGRDRLVDLLTGASGDAVERRNRIDVDHLTLMLKFGLRHDSNCLDAGANHGLFLNEIQQVAPHGHHIAYEPLPHLCAGLRQRFPGVDVRRRALSNEDGKSPFVHVLDPVLEACSGFSRQKYPREVQTETLTVTTERLDDHVPDGWLPNFVKIDVEGAELLVIEGAMDTLRRAKPTIAFEHGRHLDDPGASNEIYRLICDRVGLRLFDMDGNGPLDQPRFLDGLNSRWNWIAHE
jgi:FkbM family methyltransferase